MKMTTPSNAVSISALRSPLIVRAAHSPYARVAPERVIAATRMPRIARNTRMFTFAPTFSSITENITSTASRTLKFVKSIAPEKIPIMSDI